MPAPLWLNIARTHLGLSEVHGPGSNAEILQWAKDEGGWIESYFVEDDIAWCALFACHCLHAAGRKDPHTLAAADFARWGQELPGRALGAVVVLSRPGGHHVGFYVGQTADGRLRLLGGNQGDMVKEAWFDPARVIAWRWPAEDALPTLGGVVLAADGQGLSVNER